MPKIMYTENKKSDAWVRFLTLFKVFRALTTLTWHTHNNGHIYTKTSINKLTKDLIMKTIKSLKNTKSVGPDRISFQSTYFLYLFTTYLILPQKLETIQAHGLQLRYLLYIYDFLRQVCLYRFISLDANCIRCSGMSRSNGRCVYEFCRGIQ